jgi:CubicO group peptidase (beta-lactamase class C family)
MRAGLFPLLLTLVIAGLPGGVIGQNRGPTAELERLPALMAAGRIPGMSIAVIENGEVFWTGGFGTRSADSKPVDENTVFEAASLSKPLVAYIALKLVDAGQLVLDRPLAEYAAIPDLADPRAGRITTRMVLSHTTGLQNERIGSQRLELAFDPGTQFRYSGEGFLLLQQVVESITREPLDAIAGRLVLKPLGMTRSGFVWRDDFGDNAAIGHGDLGAARQPSRPRTARASSSLQTTAIDYARFVRAFMSREGLSRQTFDQMLAPHVQAAPRIHWGLGWALEASGTGYAPWHWGDNSNSGFTAFVWMDPRRGRAVLYFANSTTGLSIVRDVLAIMGGTHAAPDFMGYPSVK